MREGFFNGYPGLLTRCNREVKYASEHGYCRSVFGGTRNLIELMLRGSYDEKNESGRLKNLENIAKNYLAQQLEACIRGRAMREMQEWLFKNNYKSFLWNEIHDSIDIYLYKAESCEVLSHLKHLEERKIPELEDNWVPLPVDCNISDKTKGQYYKEENSPEGFGVHWKDLEYEDPDPFGVELKKEFETDYFNKRRNYWKNKGKMDPLARKIQKYRSEKGV